MGANRSGTPICNNLGYTLAALRNLMPRRPTKKNWKIPVSAMRRCAEGILEVEFDSCLWLRKSKDFWLLAHFRLIRAFRHELTFLSYRHFPSGVFEG